VTPTWRVPWGVWIALGFALVFWLIAVLLVWRAISR